MRIHAQLALGLLAAAFLFFPAPTAAQGCWVCEDRECVAAEWDDFGWTQCVSDWFRCYTNFERCWGPDPEFAVLAVRADGTLLAPETGEANVAASMEFAMAESAGFSAAVRSYERNCKGIITRRVYGEAERAELAQRTKHLTI